MVADWKRCDEENPAIGNPHIGEGKSLGAWGQIEKLKSERDRLRKALQKIINTPYLGAYNDPTIHNIARTALEDK